MKTLSTIALFLLALTAFADVKYPVKNFRYITDWDYQEEVERSDKFVVMIFSSQDCLERVIIDRECWLFEKKLDFFVPKFGPQVKVVGFNTYFENYRVSSNLMIRKNPSVILMKNNKILQRFEPDFRLPQSPGQLGWQDQLLKNVLEVISRIQ